MMNASKSAQAQFEELLVLICATKITGYATGELHFPLDAS